MHISIRSQIPIYFDIIVELDMKSNFLLSSDVYRQ